MTNETSSTGFPSPNDEPAWEAIARYLAGESPAAEADAISRRLAEQPEDARLFAALDRAMDRLAFQPPADLDVEAALAAVKARRAAADVAPLVPRERGERRERRAPVVRWYHGVGIAAAAALLLAVGSVVRRQTHAPRSRTPVVAQAPARTFTTPVGRRDSVRLDDGTRVLLGPGSELHVAAGYGAGHRDVALRGEALFDVVHDAARPFAVHVGSVVVRDIGTVFSVHDDGQQRVRVVVTRGSVELGRSDVPGSGVVLHAGDVAGLAGASGAAQRGAATPEDLAWTRGRLVFREATVAEVRADLRRWYGIELVVTDPALAGRHLTATFAGEPAGRVLQVIGLALGAEIERRGDSAVVHPATEPGHRR